MANLRDFLLPDLGEGLTEGEIVSWLVAVGDTIELNQPVAEVETAKAVVEVPSPFAGTVTRLHGEEGQEVEVGKPLLTIDLDGGAPVDAPSEQAGEQPANAAAQMIPDAQTVADEQGTVTAADADDDAGSGNVLVGYGTGAGGRARRRRAAPGAEAGGAGAQPAGAAGTAPAAPERPGRPLAKPPVRKLAKDLGVDLAAVSGSGPDGVITREDVERHAASDGHAAPGAAPPTAPTSQDAGVLVTDTAHQRLASAPPNEDLEERIPVRGVRKAIAAKMTTSRREIPEATTWVDVDATGLWNLRQRLNAEQQDVKVSPLAILLRACVAGLREFPEVNARLDTGTNEIVLQHWANLGFAAQTDRGLVVPVIRNADRLSILGIARELNRLAAAARDGKVTPEEMTGGTFTVSNYGSFGVDGGSAVINHPEAAIMGVGRISDRPWVRGGKIRIRKVMQLSIAFDHRICDGGEAAGFLRYVGDLVESPTLLTGAL